MILQAILAVMVKEWEEAGSDNQLLDQETLMQFIDFIAEQGCQQHKQTVGQVAQIWEQHGKAEIALKFAMGKYLRIRIDELRECIIDLSLNLSLLPQ